MVVPVAHALKDCRVRSTSSKLQIQFHQYYPEDQRKDTQKLFLTYSHDKGRTWQRQNKMGNLC